ncbi:GntR family transcriptional regulator [Cryobacterium algoricola]|uniref:GntR family transcriptional regulator n=1 Tax=Cryobacterium algoricola TaxID=1259183 RepID=A0ABY2IF95_9MICO|nr:GntR family transcriptional regulator [Cryobacterium algoricola]TFB87268.1 GntR family transcriptional regulator [Cryobacterium algoricola]
MFIRLEPQSTWSLKAQIAQQIRREIAKGSLYAGERLPSARTLGTTLGVNIHTVLSAYAELRDEGFIELRRGRGAVVREAESTGSANVISLAREFVREAQRMGMAQDEAVRVMLEVDEWMD